MLKKINTYLKEIEDKMVLNKTEKEILRILVLNTKPMTIGDMWESKHINRLTSLYSLKKLEKRGLVKRNTDKKSHTWVFASSEINTSVGVRDSENKYISIDDAYEFLRKSNQQKVIGIQGLIAVDSLVKNMKQKPGRFTGIHIRQKLRQTIIDAILTDSAADKIQHLPKEALLTHFGRPTILHVIPESNFISEYEIISDGKSVIITDHKINRAVVSGDPLIIKAITALLEIIKTGGVKKNIAEIYGMDKK